MDIAAIGGLIGGVGQLAGGASGLLNRGGSSSGNDASFYQNWRNDDMAFAREQFGFQKQLAESGIRMRVADAKAAGIHPLAALGFSGSNVSPISVGSHNVDTGGYRDRSPDIGSSLANMGQGIGRAVAATQTPKERVESAYEMTVKSQQIASNDLDLQIKAAQLARLSQPGLTGGGIPSSATGSHGIHEVKPYEATTVNPGSPYAAAGPPQSENEYRHTSQGGLSAYPSSGLNIDEISSPGYLGWMWRNRVLPYFGDTKSAPPRSQLPPGAIGWVHHFGEWHPRYPSRDFSHLPKWPRDYPRGDHHLRR